MSRYKYFWSVGALLILQQAVGPTCLCADAASGQFTAAPPTCPGDTITFRCTVGGDNTMVTTWRVDESSQCPLLHSSSSVISTCGSGNAYTATSGTGFGTSATSFSSALSVTATPALNGTLIECFGPGTVGDLGNTVGGSTFRILGPPSLHSLSCVDLSGDTNGAVSVTVRWTLNGGDSADFYLINITTNDPQPPYGGLLNITTPSVTQRELTGFQAGYQYTITVRGVNCASQEGSDSEPLTVTPHVPDAPASCVSTAVYNQSSQMLLAIDNTWDALTDVDPAVQGEVCPDPIADIIQYQVILRTGSFVNSESMNIARCAVGRCSHSFAPASNHLNGSVPSSFDSVSVAAENVVGVGAARTCAAQPISTTNGVLRVMVVNVSSAETQLQCTFLSGFTGSTDCRVQYGTDQTHTNLPYSAESNDTGTAGETVSVVLRERLNSSTTYYYTVSAVSGDVTVAVQGSFTTPQYNCYLSALQRPWPDTLPDDYPQCQDNQDIVTTITIPNGVIVVTCYSGRQFMSVASYVCNEGYQPNVTSSVRVCRHNGTWSGAIIACDFIQTTCSQSASTWTVVVVIGVCALVFGILTGLLTGILVYHCISKHRSPSSKPESSSEQHTGPLYEEVSATCAGEKIALRENMAYGPVQKLEVKNVANN